MCLILSPQGKYAEAKLGSRHVFQFGKLEKGCMTSRCLKYHFSLSLLLPKGLCSLCSGARKVRFEVPFSQKDELMSSIASLG